MKKGLVTKLGAAALALSLVTASLVGGTFAKYTKTVTGSATGTVAKFEFNTDSASLNNSTPLSLLPAGEKLTPGSSGTFTVKVDSKSDIKLNYVIKIGAITGMPSGEVLTFYEYDGGTKGDVIPVEGIGGEIAAATGDTAVTGEKVIYWEWADKDIDVSAGGAVSVVINATGTQAE